MINSNFTTFPSSREGELDFCVACINVRYALLVTKMFGYVLGVLCHFFLVDLTLKKKTMALQF